MKTTGLLLGLALVGAGATGCAAEARTGAYVETGPPVVFNEPPTLIEADSGVWVVRDYDYPVYYVDNEYWVYDNGVWYRADSYDRGWVRADVQVVPRVIVHRNHHAYVHYRGVATARTRVAPRGPEMRPASLNQPRRYVSPPVQRAPNQRVIEQRRANERAVEQRRANERAAEQRQQANQRAAEQQRLDAERRRLDNERAAEQRRVDAQQRRLDSEHAAQQRQIENERAAAQRRAVNQRAVDQRRLKEQRAAEQRRRAQERDRREKERREK